MKKIITLLAVLAVSTTSFASTGFKLVPKKATELFLPIGNNIKISLMSLSEISIKEYEKVSGKHLNFFQKLSFKAAQKKLRNGIAADGIITNKKLAKAMSEVDHSVGFHMGGFALGFFFNFIGVIVAYLIKTDKDVDRNRRKWAWIGLGVSFLLFSILILTVITLIPRVY